MPKQINKLPIKVKNQSPNISGKDAANVFSELLRAQSEYKNTKEQELTKRQAIRCNLEIQLEKIKLQRDVIISSLEKDYNFRKESIDKLFEVIDKAISSDKDDIVIAALNNLEGIVKETPLKAILGKINESFQDNSIELVI